MPGQTVGPEEKTVPGDLPVHLGNVHNKQITDIS